MLRLTLYACFLVGSCFAVHAQAATYYVAVNGSDNNLGSVTSPFRSIQKAADIVNPGDKVIVQSGVYTDTNGDDFIVNLTRGGTSDAWITFSSASKWGAILDGKKYSTGFGWNFGPGARYVRIENFEIRGFGWKGIHSNADAQYIYVYGNHIHDIGRFCTDTGNAKAGVYQGSGTSDHVYDSNVIHDIGRLGDGEKGCTNSNKYWQNHDHSFYITKTTNVKIINNILYNNAHGWQVAISRGSSNITVSNNTIAYQNPNRDGHVLIYANTEFGPIRNITVQNNIFFNPRRGGVRIDLVSNQRDIIIRNNLIYGASEIVSATSALTAEFSVENNIVAQDPQFVNEPNHDFQLKMSSPAIDTGIEQNAPLLDHEGNRRPENGAWDIGAYEFSGLPGNRFPQAKIGVDVIVGEVPLVVSFSASESFDTDGTIAEYQWTFGDGTTSSQQNPLAHTYDQVGSYPVTLTVVDNDGATDQDQVTISVLGEGRFTTLYIEAESGLIRSPLTVVTDPDASGGAYIFTPVGTGNTTQPKSEAEYQFNVVDPGDYYLWVRMYGPISSMDAAFVGFNGDFERVFVSELGTYVWVKVDKPFRLNAGPNLLNIGHAEEQARIDRIFVTIAPDSRPSDDADTNSLTADITLSDPSPTKAGSVQITLLASGTITKNPGPVVFEASDGFQTSITLEGEVPGDVFTGIFVIDDKIADGKGFFSLPQGALENASQNRGNEIAKGRDVIIDQTPPATPRNSRARVSN